jgi:lipopolysaccharide transport system ATP-binding protein
MTGFWLDVTDEVRSRFVIRSPWFKPGTYRLDFFVCSMGIHDVCENACQLRVTPLLPYSEPASDESLTHGVVLADFAYQPIDS